MKFLKKYSLLLAILITLATVSVVASLTQNTNDSAIRAVNGYIDLSDHSLAEQGPVSLKGEWELYKNQLLTYADFQNNQPLKGQLQIVPGSYVPVNPAKGQLGYGYATYRLRVKVNDEVDILGLKILTMSTSYKLMINEKVIATNGVVADNKEDYQSNYRPQAVVFEAPQDTFEIIVQVANYTYNRTGMWHSLVLGDYQQIIESKVASTNRTILLLGGIIFIIIYQIGIYFLQRKNNKASLYLIISMLIVLIRILFTGDYLATNLFKDMPVSSIAWFEYITIIWAPAIISLFNYQLFKEEIPEIAIKTIIGITVINSILITALPTNIYTQYKIIVETFYISVFLYLIWCNYKSLQKGRTFAGICLIGQAVIVGACIIDALYFRNIITIVEGGTVPYSVFIIVIIQIFIVTKRYEKSIDDVRLLSRKLIQQDKIKDDFLAYTSHEIRTPLHGMVSLVEHIIDSGDNLHEAQKKNLGYALSSGQRLANLVNNILDFAKLKNNDLRLEFKDVSLTNVTQFVIETQKYLLKDSDVQLYHQLDPKILVYADENRLIQILTNLITNAIKFTESGQITVGSEVNQSQVIIWVEDTGSGIPADKLETVFEAYQQLEESRHTLGTGLGLNIAKYLVELHGGRIWAESEPGTGSKFTFTLQTGKGLKLEPSNLTPVQPEPRMLDADFSSLKIYHSDQKNAILIVDDDATNLQSLINILSGERYQLLVTSDSSEAIKAINNYHVDMAILDVIMDDVSGYELCQHIRKKYTLYQMPILLLTAQVDTQALIHGFRSGANDFLTKPFSSEELRARVKTLITMQNSVIEAINNEVAFLQAQMKPHFIYNAINVLVSLCETDPEQAGDLLIEFSHYLRKSFDFNNAKSLIPLESEIEYIKSYLKLEQARFVNKIDCDFDVDDHLGLMIPPLILQPLVENSVQHGILKKPGDGRIDIRVVRKSEHVVITIEDNGIGMDQSELHSIMFGKGSSHSVGLKNINKRLMYYYGTSLKIESEPGQGCKITITIPFLKEEPDESTDY